MTTLPAAWHGLWTALVLAFLLTPLLRYAALRWGIVDHPSDRKIHRDPTPLLGGIAVVAGVVTALFFGSHHREVVGVTLGTLGFMALGLADDFLNLGAMKLVIEFATAWLVVLTTGVMFHLPEGIAGIALTVVWIVGVANAFNCLDCADGVATSAGLAASGAFLAIALTTAQPLESRFAGALVGATVGFLPHNLHPARIFLGDAGSLAMGFLIAMLGVMLSPGIVSVPALAAPAIVLAIPIFDILYVHGRRYRSGQRSLSGLLTSTGKDHLPHRLLARGIPTRRVMLIVFLASIITGAAGVALAATRSVWSAAAIAGIVVGVLVLLERDRAGAPATPHKMFHHPGWQNPEA